MLDKYGDYYLDTTCWEANVIIMSVNLQNPPGLNSHKMLPFQSNKKERQTERTIMAGEAESTPAVSVHVGGS